MTSQPNSDLQIKIGREKHPLFPFGSWMWQRARRLIVFVFGTTILLIGIAMIVLPGPATIVIPIGLAILGTEFVWAKRLLAYAKTQLSHVMRRTENFDTKHQKYVDNLDNVP